MLSVQLFSFLQMGGTSSSGKRVLKSFQSCPPASAFRRVTWLKSVRSAPSGPISIDPKIGTTRTTTAGTTGTGCGAAHASEAAKVPSDKWTVAASSKALDDGTFPAYIMHIGRWRCGMHFLQSSMLPKRIWPHFCRRHRLVAQVLPAAACSSPQQTSF